jgi:hypothetical protein
VAGSVEQQARLGRRYSCAQRRTPPTAPDPLSGTPASQPAHVCEAPGLDARVDGAVIVAHEDGPLDVILLRCNVLGGVCACLCV